MKHQHKILMVDDDVLLQSLVSLHLEGAGYLVAKAGSGKEMFDCLNQEKDIDLILLDLGLPDEDGIVLARKLRARSSQPIIILTAREEMDTRLAGLDVGADDYLTKSVSPDELLLRIRNVLRRTTGTETTRTMMSGNADDAVRFDGWIVDMCGYAVTSPQGKIISMTPGEFRVLATLLKSRGRVLSRDQLLDAITGQEDDPSDRMIDAFISRIRKKIEKNPRKPVYIHTVTGVGYKFLG
ncbi:MAG: response regulator transcription factor [Rhodospirillales bacterium]|jgi:DNA-binding response OmpR family regulator|nr:response regulator transcription factor [Rhodospirillales bacterium]MBT4039924.1 response regulator transcription factor [Rhodospirillales bacterium]MBT4625171.1 response regulator transcription factor [Rhodospirillales bacterium]MBT5351321.1 response regulator transcription factor [Rhodospirillales bacterium]MBT5521957.1 response regulator transcription factor [Rhodospirillales bacterium]